MNARGGVVAVAAALVTIVVQLLRVARSFAPHDDTSREWSRAWLAAGADEGNDLALLGRVTRPLEIQPSQLRPPRGEPEDRAARRSWQASSDVSGRSS